MDLKVKIISNNGLIIIKDSTPYLKDYELDNGYKNYKQSEIVLMDIVSYGSDIGTIKILQPVLKLITIPILKDGNLTISHVIIPTKQWFNKLNSGNIGTSYKVVFYYDNGKFYKSTPDVGKLYTNPIEISVNDLINDNLQESNLLIESLSYISIWFLKQCYIDICKQIFNQRSLTSCSSGVDKELSYKRDILWMSLNVILYLTKVDEVEEALRIIDVLSGCNGICKLSNTTKSKGCGCNL